MDAGHPDAQPLIEQQLAESLEKVSIIALVDLFVEYAYISRASDIHIEPTRDGIRVRYRIDGLLYDAFSEVKATAKLHPEILSRIKVLSGLRTDEHLLPQDGRFRVKIVDFGDVDVRVSIMPTYYGENAILRVLAGTQNFELKDLGFAAGSQESRRGSHEAVRMILANRPTGSGKTTTLNTILRQLNRPTVSIITIEDP